MNKYIYQAKFTLQNEILPMSFSETQSQMQVFSDLSEMLTENFNNQIDINVKARLSSNKTGLLTLTSNQKLSDTDLTNISQFIDFEINEDGLNDVFGYHVETVNHQNFTQVQFHGTTNQFKLVNTYSAVKAA